MTASVASIIELALDERYYSILVTVAIDLL